MPLPDPIPSTAVVVALCATLSLLACSSLFAYVGGCHWVAHRAALRGDVEKEIREKERVRFMRNQFGMLFMNLLFSDSIQALGFASDFAWVRLGAIDPSSAFCSFQAVCIQIGDTASALWILAIAAHTAAVLTTGRKPPRAVIAVVAASIWSIVALFALIGPTAIATKHRGPYYTQAGAWCWIGEAYEGERLWLHYLLVFTAACGNAIFYGWTIVSLRSQALAGPSWDFWSDSSPSAPTVTSSSRVSSSKARRQPSISNPRLTAQAHVRSAAKKMMLYPLCYLGVVLPLTAFRLVQYAGGNPPISAQIAVGSVFTLAGLANTLLWGCTRGVITFGRARSPREDRAGRAEQNPTLRSQGGGTFSISTSLPGYLFQRETDVEVDIGPRSPKRVLQIRTRQSEDELARFGEDGPFPGAPMSPLTPVSPLTPLSPLEAAYSPTTLARFPLLASRQDEWENDRRDRSGHERWGSWP